MTLAAVGTGPSHPAARPAPPAPTPASEPAPEPARAGADGAAGTRPPGAGSSDTVSLSAAALVSQKLDALAQAVRRLGLWLDAPAPVPAAVARPTAGGDPAVGTPVLIGLAGEVGTAAEQVGAFFVAQATSSGDGRATARTNTAPETTRAGTAFPSPASPAVYARPAMPPPAGGGWTHGGATAAPAGAAPDAAPARPPAAGATGPAWDQRPSVSTVADDPPRVPGAARFSPDVPRGGDGPNGLRTRADASDAPATDSSPAGPPFAPPLRPTAGQEAAPPSPAAADRRALPPAAPRGDSPEAADAEGRPRAERSSPDPFTPGDDPAWPGPARRPREGRFRGPAADLRPPAPEAPRDDGRPHGVHTPATASIAAVASLRAAAELLAAVKLRVQDAPAPDSVGPAPARDAGTMEHLARCEAQIAAAMARVAGCADRADGPDRGASNRDRRDPAPSAGPGARTWPLAAPWAAAVRALAPFCAVAAAVWAAAALDSAPARLACAAAAVVICAARAWRALVARLPRGPAVTLRPRGRT